MDTIKHDAINGDFPATTTVLMFQRICEPSQAIFDSQRINLGKLISGVHAYLLDETNLARGKGGRVHTSIR